MKDCYPYWLKPPLISPLHLSIEPLASNQTTITAESVPIKEIFVSYWVNHPAYTRRSHHAGAGSVYSSPRAWRSAGVRLDTHCDLECGGGVGGNHIMKSLCNYNHAETDHCLRLPFEGAPIDLCKLIANEYDTCSLREVMIYANSMIVANEAERRRGIRPRRRDGPTCHPQPEPEVIAPSRWEWTTLWQPFSKWQNPSFCIDQLFFCLPAGIFRSSLPLLIPPLTCPAAPYWSSPVIGWAVIWDGHWRMSANCFSFSLFLSSRGWWSHNASDRARQGPIAVECWPE